ncbi:MAG TPA: DUF4062 domain-containing protein [Pyrinomonadaceae bacterium]|jgi:hypothetical protein
MSEITKVFLSSTARDLSDYREAVYRAVQQMDGYKCVRMEDFLSRAASPIDQCRRAVGECDLFVGIVGPLHGSSPPGSASSFTELEYHAAHDYNKPRLMFLTPPKFHVEADMIEADDKRERQAKFRRLVFDTNAAGSPFATPEELARLVVTSVRNWESAAATERKRTPPNPSANVPRTCDREHQEAAFARYLRLAGDYRPGLPLVCVVRGEEGQNHWSFVRRLCETRIQTYATERSGEKGAKVKRIDLGWQYSDDLQSRQDALTSTLFEALDPDYVVKRSDYSAAALRGLLGGSLCSVVVFQHEVHAQLWDRTSESLLRWYLGFLDGLKAEPPVPQCVVFINFVYPDARRDGLWAFWRRLRRASPFGLSRRVERSLRGIAAAPERAVEPKRAKEPARALAAAPAHAACAVLDELTCVEKKHVTKWLRDNHVSDDEAEIERAAVVILTDKQGRQYKCRNMREVESSLRNIHTRIVSEVA